MKTLPETELLTVTEISEWMNIGESSAYFLIHEEGFPLRRKGKSIRIPRAEFLRWVEHQTNNPKGYGTARPGRKSI